MAKQIILSSKYEIIRLSVFLALTNSIPWLGQETTYFYFPTYVSNP